MPPSLLFLLLADDAAKPGDAGGLKVQLICFTPAIQATPCGDAGTPGVTWNEPVAEAALKIAVPLALALSVHVPSEPVRVTMPADVTVQTKGVIDVNAAG